MIGPVMWKIENRGLCVLGLLLASATAVGQEWPQVIHRQQGGVWRLQGAEGVFVFGESSQPLMEGEIESTVQDLEAAVGAVGVKDRSRALSLLDTVSKQTMKVRRLLKALEKADPKPPKGREALGDPVAISPDGQWVALARNGGKLVIRVSNGDLRRTARESTPVQEAQDALQFAVRALRHAEDVAAARKALEKVDQEAAVLRQLLWKLKASRKR